MAKLAKMSRKWKCSNPVKYKIMPNHFFFVQIVKLRQDATLYQETLLEE